MTTPARKLLTPQMRRRLIAKRRFLGMSQKDLSGRLGTRSRSYVCQLETGHFQPSVGVLEKWCAALGLKLKVEIE